MQKVREYKIQSCIKIQKKFTRSYFLNFITKIHKFGKKIMKLKSSRIWKKVQDLKQ